MPAIDFLKINCFVHKDDNVVVSDDSNLYVFADYIDNDLSDPFYITDGPSDLDTKVFYKQDCRFENLHDLRSEEPELFI